MPTENKNIFTTLNGQEHMLNPADGKYYPIEDARKKFAQKDKSKSPEELAFEKAFEKSREPGAQKAEKHGDEPIAKRIRYGVVYNDAYKTNFHKGAIISVDIICPQTTGSTVNAWVDLTETCRAAKGAEAIVQYLDQSEFYFRVYDCARDDHWQVRMTAEEMEDYLTMKNVEGVDRQVLSVANYTELVDMSRNNRWRNLVYLYNHKKSCYSLVYEYEYDATDEEQKSGESGSWGPLVETFQNGYDGTNPIGFFYAYMAERNENGNWTPYQVLTSDISHIVEEGSGFKLNFLRPNYSFAVV